MIAVRDLSFAWPGQGALFDGVTLDLPAGRVIALTGPNGSGKSTFLRLLAGLERPAQGRIAVGGVELGRAAPRDLARVVGAVMQAADRQFLRDTVIEEVALGPRLLHLPEPLAQARAALDRLGLGAMAKAHPLDLDAGARRLVGLAAALAHGPQVLLLDEPQRGLDRANRALLGQAMRAHAASGGAVVVISHDESFLAPLADARVLFGGERLVLA